jgi:HemY protein
MKRAVAIFAGVAMVCLVAYLSWLNPTAVEFRFTPTRSVQAPLAALMVFAFVVGLLLVLAVVMIQAGRRAFVAWWQDRQQRRIERIDRWEEQGEELVWSGDAQHGRALLHKAWQRRPESAHAVLALATSYHETGELQRELLLLLEAVNHHASNPDVLLALADAHRAAGDRAAAVEVLERVRALHPHAPRVLRVLRDLYVESERWRDAATLQEALLMELRDIDHAGREREYLNVLRYQAGIRLPDASARRQALEAIADSRSGSIPVLISLGDALVAEGHADEASVLWERALRSTPRTVLVERLTGLASEPHHRERLRTLLRKLRTDQVQADNVRLLSAQLCLTDGDAEHAARELEALQAPEQAPAAVLHHLWGEVHRRRGQQEQALSAYAHTTDASAAYHCSVCQRSAGTWVGYCSQCGHWDSYRSAVEIDAR